MQALNISSQTTTLLEENNKLLENGKTHSTWLERTFGPLHPGGVRSSIFLLVATALAAFFSAAALYMLFQASKRTYANSYAECVSIILGYKSAVILQWILVVYVFFVLVAYEMMIVQILNGIFQHLGVEGGLADRHTYQSKIMAVLIVTSIFPLCLKRKLQNLNYVAALGVIAVIYVVMVIIMQTPSYTKHYWDKGHIVYEKFDWDFPASFTYAVFAFTCYTVVFQVRAEMYKPTNQRMFKVITRAVFLEFFIYGALAVFAYISLLDKIPGVILNRPALGGKNDWDIAMQIARLMMALVIYLGIPINISPCKQGIIILALGTLKRAEQNSSQGVDILVRVTAKLNLWVSFGIVYLGVFFVIVYPEILFVIKLISGYLSCSMGLLYPTLLYTKNMKNEQGGKTGAKYWAIMILGVGFSCLGYFAASLNVYQMCGGVLPGVETQGN